MYEYTDNVYESSESSQIHENSSQYIQDQKGGMALKIDDKGDPLDEIPAPKKHNSSFMRKYVKKWEYIYPWIRLDKGGNRPMCIVCMQLLGNQKSHLVRHEKTQKHQDKLKKTEDPDLEEFLNTTMNESKRATESIMVETIEQPFSVLPEQDPTKPTDLEELQRLALSNQFDLLQQQMDLVEGQKKLLIDEENRQLLRHEKEMELLRLKKELLLKQLRK